MANEEHLQAISRGVAEWNSWVAANPGVRPDLRGADLEGADLRGANLSRAHLSLAQLKGAALGGADLSRAKLNNAYMRKANLSGANLAGASLAGANLRHAVLSGAAMKNAYLRRADLSYVDLSGADLSGANLQYARFVDTTLEGATLTNCYIYGISVWNVIGEPKDQSNLVITRGPAGSSPGRGGDNQPAEPVITVDELEVAQFIYLLLNHRKIREVIATLGKKAVLILGRFIEGRKEILDSIAGELRRLQYLPIIFDFEKIPGRDYTETIQILAGLSKFVIADITKPRSVPQESQAIIPQFKIPFVKLIQQGEDPWSMSIDQETFDWVLGPIRYADGPTLIANLGKVVDLAEVKSDELARRKAGTQVKTISIEEL